MTTPKRPVRRLWYETRDWARSVQGIPCNRTHADETTAQHNPEVWHGLD